MKSCSQCNQENPGDANFCHQCGTALDSTTVAGRTATEVPDPPTVQNDEVLWRQFIGPNANHYLAQFKKFSSNNQPKFALSWNWPAFLYISFLWFLYRKMYLHAAVYAVGPMISTFITGDISIGIAWSVIAGATANYLYYWHCKERIAEIKKSGWMNQTAQETAMKEAGGVQLYVVWVGIGFYVIFLVTLILKIIQEGPPDSDRLPSRPAKLAVKNTL